MRHAHPDRGLSSNRAGSSVKGWDRPSQWSCGRHDHRVIRSERAAGRGSPRPRASDAPDSAAVTGLARVGLVAYGLVHLLVAWLALQVAWGRPGGDADQSGAMAAVASTTVGPPSLSFSRSVWPHLPSGSLASCGGCGVVQALTAVVAQRPWEPWSRWARRWSTWVSRRSRSASPRQRAHRAAPGSSAPPRGSSRCRVGGSWSGSRRWWSPGWGCGNGSRGCGMTSSKRSTPTGCRPPAAASCGGWVASVSQPRARPWSLLGGLFGWAAASFDASKATGLDGAIHTIVEAPFGAAHRRRAGHRDIRVVLPAARPLPIADLRGAAGRRGPSASGVSTSCPALDTFADHAVRYSGRRPGPRS